MVLSFANIQLALVGAIGASKPLLQRQSSMCFGHMYGAPQRCHWPKMSLRHVRLVYVIFCLYQIKCISTISTIINLSSLL